MNAVALAKNFEQAAKSFYPNRGPRHLHPGQWAILRYLSDPQTALPTIGSVARHLRITHAPASRAVASLVRKNLVSYEPSVEDRRVRQISLTNAGRGLLMDDPIGRLAAAIEDLPWATRTQFAAAIAAISTRLYQPSNRSDCL